MSPSLHLIPNRGKKTKKRGVSFIARIILGFTISLAVGGVALSHFALNSHHASAPAFGHLELHLAQSKALVTAKKAPKQETSTTSHRRLNNSDPQAYLAKKKKELAQKLKLDIGKQNEAGGREATLAKRREEVLARRQALIRQKQVVVRKPVIPYNIANDPLQNPDFNGTFHSIDMKPAVEYLGVLIDGGRHFFPIDWLKRTVDRLADMNYNLIHLRLTDDQAFNVILDSHPELAYPSHVNNDKLDVWTAKELREFSQYCRARGVSIMPEINVPGHGGAWAGIPGMVVQCPAFTCDKGYGLPINVTHPDFSALLIDVLKEVVDIFNPPFLHLGGDEVDMSAPCFAEHGSSMFNYQAFEDRLKVIIKEVNYPEEQVVRWELTGQAHLQRAGGIEQFWFSHPGTRHQAAGRWFVSTWLYFDTNNDQNAYEVWTKTRHSFFNIRQKKTVPTAIIAGTFELSTTWWYDRNVLGRLLAVAIGAANETMTATDPKAIEAEVNAKYTKLCKHLGWGDSMCLTDGRPVIPTADYTAKWKAGWVHWKTAICERMTTSMSTRQMITPNPSKTGEMGNQFFWDVFGKIVSSNSIVNARNLSGTLQALNSPAVAHSGIILDVTSSPVSSDRLTEIRDKHVMHLGFNLIQLPLVGDSGFVFQAPSLPHSLLKSLVTHTTATFHTEVALRDFVESSRKYGIKIMPEISVSTRATGWYASGFVMKCPVHACETGSLTAAVDEPLYPAAVFTLIYTLRQLFSSEFFHLGYDDRESAQPCLHEANKDVFVLQAFEEKLKGLLAVMGLTTSNVIRYYRPDSPSYEVRAGDINHYESSVLVDKVDENVAGFVSVDILEGPWVLYRHVKDLIEKKPLGIMAQVRDLRGHFWEEMQIPGRLLVFSIAMSSLPTFESLEDLEQEYVRVCKGLVTFTDCKLPSNIEVRPLHETETRQHREQVCNNLSQPARQYKSIPVEPFYSEEQMTERRNSPSPFTVDELKPVLRQQATVKNVSDAGRKINSDSKRIGANVKANT